MTVIDLFVAIYHQDTEEISRILTVNPELMTQCFPNDDKRHTSTNELYDRCNKDTILNDPHYRQEDALLFAARLGHKEVCEQLISLGANVNTVNTYGHNAFMSAIENYTIANFDTALMILAQPSLNLKHRSCGKYDALGQTMKRMKRFTSNQELLAFKVQELIVALLDKKQINTKTGEEAPAFDLNRPQGKNGETAFILACESHNWIIAVYLIYKGADYSIEAPFLYCKRDMYSSLTSNKFFPPAAKEKVLQLIEEAIIAVDNKYGPYKHPEHLYTEIDGRPCKFDAK